MKKDFGVKTWLYPMSVLMIATYSIPWPMSTVPSPLRSRKRSK